MIASGGAQGRMKPNAAAKVARGGANAIGSMKKLRRPRRPRGGMPVAKRPRPVAAPHHELAQLVASVLSSIGAR
jgi:hypothetical protein